MLLPSYRSLKPSYLFTGSVVYQGLPPPGQFSCSRAQPQCLQQHVIQSRAHTFTNRVNTGYRLQSVPPLLRICWIYKRNRKEKSLLEFGLLSPGSLHLPPTRREPPVSNARICTCYPCDFFHVVTLASALILDRLLSCTEL